MRTSCLPVLYGLSVVLVSIIFLIPLSFLHAQFGLPGTETILTLNPDTPAPGQSFTARVEAYAYDINRASIAWTIDGVTLERYANQQQISLVAPALGQALPISVRVVEQGGRPHTVSRIIAPSAVDIIIEAETRVPHFYKGKPLPTPGSTARLIAFPSLYRPSGTLINPDQIVYTWKMNDVVVRSGTGMRTVTINVPTLGPAFVLLTVESTDGTARFTSGIDIPVTRPQTLFYEDNPLYGLSRNALPQAFTLLSEEIAVRAEPYFVSDSIFENPQYEWSVGGVPIQNQTGDPQTMTLRRGNGAGSASVSFSILNMRSLLQSTSDAFTVFFE